MYEERVYRDRLRDNDLVSFEVKQRETDLFVLAHKNLEEETREAILRYRADLEEYIRKDPAFKEARCPHGVKDGAPLIVRAMAEAGIKAGVGPMAAVAGAMAEFVGRYLLDHSQEIIIENGGDIFIATNKPRQIGIFAGNSPLSDKLTIEIESATTPLGVCTSSGTVGHSLSFGRADAVVVVSASTPLADAAATAICNTIQGETDIPRGIEMAKEIEGIKGLIIIIDSKMGIWGDIKLVDKKSS